MVGAGDSDPGLVVRDGVPVSTRFDDVYFSREGGLAESRHVFLGGAGLPDAWAGRRRFTIAETGFGTGLNFLAAWLLWRRHRPPGGVLHYLAVEGFPIGRGSLAGILAPVREVGDIAVLLAHRYPRPDPGLHRIWFDGEGVCLTLAIGEAGKILPRVEATVDAWFLDGFAPARNPGMWEPAVLDEVARLAAPGCRIATFTVAGAVCRGLEERGFAVERRPGFGRKRECLSGRFGGRSADPARDPAQVAVIGAGVAGAAVAGALSRRGVAVDWVERRPVVAAEASGNPVGVLMPRPILGETAAGPLSVAAFRHVLAVCAERGLPVGGNGVLDLAVDGDLARRHSRLQDAGRLEPVDGRIVDAPEASRIAGVSLDRPAIWYRRAGWVSPPALVRALAEGTPVRLGCPVGRLERVGGGWRLVGPDGAVVTEADVVVAAGGPATVALTGLSDLPLRPVRGQVSELLETALSRRLRAVLTFGGYLTPAAGGRHIAGATYDREGYDPAAWPQPVAAESHDRIREGMPEPLHGWFAGIAPVGGRAAIRATTPDRQPLAGAVTGPDGQPVPGLHTLSGLGSRGLVTAPLLAELVVSSMLGEPLPLERDLAAAVAPGRFARGRRDDRRAGSA